MRFGDFWFKVGIRYFSRIQCSRKATPQFLIHVVVSGNDEQMPLLDSSGIKKMVKEFCRGCIFAPLAAVSDITCSENQVGFLSGLAESINRTE